MTTLELDDHELLVLTALTHGVKPAWPEWWKGYLGLCRKVDEVNRTQKKATLYGESSLPCSVCGEYGESS